jgi:hypothetical protein
MDSSLTTGARVDSVLLPDAWLNNCTSMPRIRNYEYVTGPYYYDTVTYEMLCDTADSDQTYNLQLGGDTKLSPTWEDYKDQWALGGVTSVQNPFFKRFADDCTTEFGAHEGQFLKHYYMRMRINGPLVAA